MYENGKRVNGYNKKTIHKKCLKKQYVSGYYYCSGSNQTWEDYLAHLCENEKENVKYWRAFYLSGPRQYARRETNRKLRRDGKILVYITDDYDSMYEDIYAMNYGGYRKVFDYAWTVW